LVIEIVLKGTKPERVDMNTDPKNIERILSLLAGDKRLSQESASSAAELIAIMFGGGSDEDKILKSCNCVLRMIHEWDMANGFHAIFIAWPDRVVDIIRTGMTCNQGYIDLCSSYHKGFMVGCMEAVCHICAGYDVELRRVIKWKLPKPFGELVRDALGRVRVDALSKELSGRLSSVSGNFLQCISGRLLFGEIMKRTRPLHESSAGGRAIVQELLFKNVGVLSPDVSMMLFAQVPVDPESAPIPNRTECGAEEKNYCVVCDAELLRTHDGVCPSCGQLHTMAHSWRDES
jgi:hypothetical protein